MSLFVLGAWCAAGTGVALFALACIGLFVVGNIQTTKGYEMGKASLAEDLARCQLELFQVKEERDEWKRDYEVLVRTAGK